MTSRNYRRPSLYSMTSSAESIELDRHLRQHGARFGRSGTSRGVCRSNRDSAATRAPSHRVRVPRCPEQRTRRSSVSNVARCRLHTELVETLGGHTTLAGVPPRCLHSSRNKPNRIASVPARRPQHQDMAEIFRQVFAAQ